MTSRKKKNQQISITIPKSAYTKAYDNILKKDKEQKIIVKGALEKLRKYQPEVWKEEHADIIQNILFLGGTFDKTVRKNNIPPGIAFLQGMMCGMIGKGFADLHKDRTLGNRAVVLLSEVCGLSLEELTDVVDLVGRVFEQSNVLQGVFDEVERKGGTRFEFERQ